MNARVMCDYCHQPREFSTDLHGCPQSLKAQAYVAGLIDSMKTMRDPRTGEPWDRRRGQRLESIATGILISGGEVRPREN